MLKIVWGQILHMEIPMTFNKQSRTAGLVSQPPLYPLIRLFLGTTEAEELLDLYHSSLVHSARPWAWGVLLNLFNSQLVLCITCSTICSHTNGSAWFMLLVITATKVKKGKEGNQVLSCLGSSSWHWMAPSDFPEHLCGHIYDTLWLRPKSIDVI